MVKLFLVSGVGLGVWQCLEHRHVEEGIGWQLSKGAALSRPPRTLRKSPLGSSWMSLLVFSLLSLPNLS